MPKHKSGNDPWKAVAVKLPPDLLEEVGRYADLYHTSISALIREGLALRMHGQQPAELSSSMTVIPPATAAVFTRLADTLSTAVDELRKVCNQPTAEEYNGNTATLPALEQPAAEGRYHGNTVIPLVQGDATARIADDGPADVLGTVTEAVTETVAVTEPNSQARAYGEVPAGVLAVLAQRQSATAAELAKALGDDTKAGTKTVWQALQRLLKRGAVLREGQQYRLPT
jgi:hypothetical protein